MKSSLMTYMIIFEPLTVAQALALLISLLQTVLIAGGLWMMHHSSQSRNRQLDQQDRKLDQQREEFNQRMDQQDRKLDMQQEALRELSRKTGHHPQALGRHSPPQGRSTAQQHAAVQELLRRSV